MTFPVARRLSRFSATDAIDAQTVAKHDASASWVGRRGRPRRNRGLLWRSVWWRLARSCRGKRHRLRPVRRRQQCRHVLHAQGAVRGGRRLRRRRRHGGAPSLQASPPEAPGRARPQADSSLDLGCVTATERITLRQHPLHGQGDAEDGGRPIPRAARRMRPRPAGLLLCGRVERPPRAARAPPRSPPQPRQYSECLFLRSPSLPLPLCLPSTNTACASIILRSPCSRRGGAAWPAPVRGGWS